MRSTSMTLLQNNKYERAGFSGYFKHHTRKTFSDFVTEIRTGYSCKMLMKTITMLSEISYQSDSTTSQFCGILRRLP